MTETWWRQQEWLGGRRGGKTSAMKRAVAEASERGEHVHVLSSEGSFCAAKEPGDCTLPRWDGTA